MKYKIIFGIAIPLLLIIALAIVTSFGEIGVKRSFNDLSLSSAFQNNEIKTVIELGEIKLSNENVFTKRYEIPRMMVCLYDKEGVKTPQDAGSLEFSRGDKVTYSDPYSIKSYSYYSFKSVEVKPNEELSVRFFLSPTYRLRNRNYSQIIADYGDYDQLVIFEVSQNGVYNYQSSNCYEINDDTLDEAIVINIVD